MSRDVWKHVINPWQVAEKDDQDFKERFCSLGKPAKLMETLSAKGHWDAYQALMRTLLLSWGSCVPLGEAAWDI